MDDINLTAESSFFAPNIHEYLEFFAFLVYIYLSEKEATFICLKKRLPKVNKIIWKVDINRKTFQNLS